MATAYEMEFPGSKLERRALRTAWLKHNILFWLHEKGELVGVDVAPLFAANGVEEFLRPRMPRIYGYSSRASGGGAVLSYMCVLHYPRVSMCWLPVSPVIVVKIGTSKPTWVMVIAAGGIAHGIPTIVCVNPCLMAAHVQHARSWMVS